MKKLLTVAALVGAGAQANTIDIVKLDTYSDHLAELSRCSQAGYIDESQTNNMSSALVLYAENQGIDARFVEDIAYGKAISVKVSPFSCIVTRAFGQQYEKNIKASTQ